MDIANHSNSITENAQQILEEAMIDHQGSPVGIAAACDAKEQALNYDQCFTRDFAVAALALLMQGKTEIVRNFLTQMVELQNCRKQMDCFQPGQGLMPASFKVEGEKIIPDFGESAIARVAPVDSCFWWLFILRAYVKATDDWTLAQQPEFQNAIRLILDLYLTARFEMLPTMLVPDGSFTIDRRMGVYGHPLDIQALFYMALRSAEELLPASPDNDPCLKAARDRVNHLTYHIRQYYWLNLSRLNEIHRYNVEEYGEAAINKFNIYPDTIPDWLVEWLPETGGYFVGNLGPGRIDYRFFTQGNLMAIITSLANESQSQRIMDLLEQRWSDLVGQMPMKLCFPALEGQDWRTLTGSDPKNVPWSYHNGGSWPFLLWLLAAAAQKTGRTHLATQAFDLARQRLPNDQWPEYYDSRNGRLIGRQARKFQTWTIAGFLSAESLLENPKHLQLVSFPEEAMALACFA